MSTCKIRAFRSLERSDAKDIGSFNASSRVSNDEKNIILQLHGKNEDSVSADTGYFLCFFPREAAKLAMKLLDSLYDQGFDIDGFEKKWLENKNAPKEQAAESA